MIATVGSSPGSSSPPEVECPSCRCVTSLPCGVEGLAVNFATADVVAGLEDDSSYRSAFSWPHTREKPPGEWLPSSQGHVTERRNNGPGSPGAMRDGAGGKKRQHRRSLSWQGASLAGMVQGEPLACEGDGWTATFRGPVFSRRMQQGGNHWGEGAEWGATPTTPVSRAVQQSVPPGSYHTQPAAEKLPPSSLPRERAYSEFVMPSQCWVPGSSEALMPVGRPRSQTERSAAWVEAARRQSVQHVAMMELAEESLHIAEAMQEIEVAESRKSFIEMKARLDQGQGGGGGGGGLGQEWHVAAPVVQRSSQKEGPGQKQVELYLGGVDMEHPMFGEEEEEEDQTIQTLGARLSPEQKRERDSSSPMHHWGEASEPPHTGEGSRGGDIIQPGERHPPRGRLNRARNPCGRNGAAGECCVGNTGWTNMLHWMGLLSLDIGS